MMRRFFVRPIKGKIFGMLNNLRKAISQIEAEDSFNAG